MFFSQSTEQKAEHLYPEMNTQLRWKKKTKVQKQFRILDVNKLAENNAEKHLNCLWTFIIYSIIIVCSLYKCYSGYKCFAFGILYTNPKNAIPNGHHPEWHHSK